MVVYLCVCRFPRAFINLPLEHMPYPIGVVSFLDVLAEKDKFEPTVALDKFIMFEVPKFSGCFWKKMRDIKIWDMLTFVEDLPNISQIPHPRPSF